MQKNILTIRNLFILYFIGICIALVMVFTNFGFWWCPSPDNEKLFAQPDEDEEHVNKHCKNLLSLQDQLKEWEINLMATERELKRIYPEYTDSILRKYTQPDLPQIYVIMPTYTRPVQKAELTRIANTLLHVKGLHWIVVEDSENKTELVHTLLKRSGVTYTHLSATTPPSHKLKSTDPNWLKPRGVPQRNAGLQWIRRNLHVSRHKGVVYFADDDNTYDLQLFEEMRYTNRVSVWPVGLAGYLRYESPLVTNGRVTGWFTFWKPERAFALDMAGFAVNIKLLLGNPNVEFDYFVGRGEQESHLLGQLVRMDDLEPKASNCTMVLVWHTRTEPAKLKNEQKMAARGLQPSNPNIEV